MSEFDVLLAEMEMLAESQTELSNRLVPGHGNPQADIMFIGEAPGKKEDEFQKPFVGRAGNLLSEMLASVEMKREDVWISNVVKCRPPNNRDPLPSEVQQWWPLLEREIAIINPKVICPLGRHAMNRFFPDFKISQVHGKVFRRPDNRIYVVLYHPAVALYNGSQKQVLFDDFARVKQVVEQIDNQTLNIEEE